MCWALESNELVQNELMVQTSDPQILFEGHPYEYDIFGQHMFSLMLD